MYRVSDDQVTRHTLAGAAAAAFLPSLADFFSTFLSTLALAAAAGGAAVLLDFPILIKFVLE